MSLENIFDKMWKIYTSSNPDALKIFKLFLKKEKKIVNDHIALRTCKMPYVNKECIASFFEKLGYQIVKKYYFKEKKLEAFHLEFTKDSNRFPKIFISELMIEYFSNFLQSTMHKVLSDISKDFKMSENLLVSKRHWNVNYNIYEKLRNESEYAAWFYAFGFCANHFTVLVNNLKSFSSLEEVNSFLKAHGFKLNVAGGEIKGTSVLGLRQSSTVANKIEVKFIDGIYKVPYCYYEFAQRYFLNGKIYQGFISLSADKIFESTNKW